MINGLLKTSSPARFFQPVTAIIVPVNILHNFVNQVDECIVNVPNLGIGSNYADIRFLRALVYNSAQYFHDFNYASAYISWLYRVGQCDELADIIYVYIAPLLPPGTILNKLGARWADNGHAFVEIKLPKGYIWEGGGSVRFCDVWHKKLNPSAAGVYTSYEMNDVLKEIGYNNKPFQINIAASKILPITGVVA